MRKISPPPGFDPRTVQPVASRYTDYATRPTITTIPCGISQKRTDLNILVPYSRVKKGETVAWERVEWIDVALDKDTWWPVLDTAINYLIAHNAGNF